MSDINLKFARGGAELTVELLDKLKASTSKENILISPFSIQTCMALAFAGAKGDTAEEIARVMKYVSQNSTEVAETFRYVLEKYKDSDLLKIANKVYLQEGHRIKDEYALVTKEQYHAGAECVNFAQNVAAANTINSWVEDKTAGKITNLIPSDSLSGDTRLVLLNALHFKGEWNEKFNPDETTEDDFWLNETESVKVSYMHRKSDFRYKYFRQYECGAVEIPYKDSDLSMFVMLPQRRDGLKDLAEKLKDVNLLDIPDQLDIMRDMILMLPKFKIDYSVELSNVLKEMGIIKAFSNNADLSNILESVADINISKVFHKTSIEVNEEGTEAAMGITHAFDKGADFSNILEPTDCLTISRVFHKTSIEVNEEGTEAAAATGMKIMLCCMPFEFTVDHPFLYFIWNKKNILFAGAFVNPRA